MYHGSSSAACSGGNTLAVILSLLMLLVLSAILCKQGPHTFTRSNTVTKLQSRGFSCSGYDFAALLYMPWHAPSVSQTPSHLWINTYPSLQPNSAPWLLLLCCSCNLDSTSDVKGE